MSTGKIREINENSSETEFPQRNAIINYGSAPVSTYNLVNCIAIGGVFRLPDGTLGSFLTHESPTDYKEHKSKLERIYNILKEKNAELTQIILFHIDIPAKNIYNNGLDTTRIIKIMADYTQSLFGIEPISKEYTCDLTTLRCGKARISPTAYNSSLAFIKSLNNPNRAGGGGGGGGGGSSMNLYMHRPYNRSAAAAPRVIQETFEPIYLKEYKIQCPLCEANGFSSTGIIKHVAGCPNENKIPKIEWSKMAAAQKAGRRRTKRRLRHRRHTRN